jgi:hypothetical protein
VGGSGAFRSKKLEMFCLGESVRMRRADRPAFSDSIVTAIYHYLKNSLSLSKGIDASRLLICLLCRWGTRVIEE